MKNKSVIIFFVGLLFGIFLFFIFLLNSEEKYILNNKSDISILNNDASLGKINDKEIFLELAKAKDLNSFLNIYFKIKNTDFLRKYKDRDKKVDVLENIDFCYQNIDTSSEKLVENILLKEMNINEINEIKSKGYVNFCKNASNEFRIKSSFCDREEAKDLFLIFIDYYYNNNNFLASSKLDKYLNNIFDKIRGKPEYLELRVKFAKYRFVQKKLLYGRLDSNICEKILKDI